MIILVYTKNPVAKLSKYIQIPSNSTYMYTDWRYQFEKYDALNVCFMDKEAAQRNRIKVVAITNTTNFQSKVRTFKMSRQQELSQDSVLTIVRYWPSHFTQNGHMTIILKLKNILTILTLFGTGQSYMCMRAQKKIFLLVR